MQRSLSAVYRSRDFRQEWESLLSASHSLYSLYQSPDWFDHLRCTDAEATLTPVAVRDNARQLVGVVPLSRGAHYLRFEIGSHLLWRFQLRAVSILGGQPLVIPDAQIYDQLFA